MKHTNSGFFSTIAFKTIKGFKHCLKLKIKSKAGYAIFNASQLKLKQRDPYSWIHKIYVKL